MLTFREERVADVWDELYPLACEHHRSSQNYKRHEPFCPSRARYEQYNDAGLYKLLTARDHGLLAGYFGAYLMQSMYSQLPILREDAFYLSPACRGGRNALRFLQFIEEYLRQEVPTEMLFSCETDNDSGIKRLLAHLDYFPAIMVWSKCLPARADSALPNPLEVAHVGSESART
jgi:hypothetical protein